MENLPTKIPREAGNLNDGLEYERKLLLFIAASLSQNTKVKDFAIVSNPKGIEKIDDVVVRVSFVDGGKEDIALFIQSKLTTPDKLLWLSLNNKKPIQKYYEIKLKDYQKAFDNLITIMDSNAADTEQLRQLLKGVDVKNYYACIFTNMEKVDPELQRKQFDEDHPVYFLDTQNCGQYRQFDYEKDAKFNTNFYKQLYVFLGQPTQKDIDKTIAQVLGEDSKKMTHLDKVIKDFMQRGLFCGVLTKQEFEIKLCEVVVNYWMVEDKKIDIIMEKYTELWKKIFSEEEIINLCEDNIAALLAYHYQCVIRKEVDEYFDWHAGVTKLTQTTKDCIQQKYSKNVTVLNDLLFLLWRENKIPLTIKPEYTPNILNFLKKFKTLKRKFVIFCTEDSPELKEYSSKKSVITYVRDIKVNETLEKAFDLEVSLEGRRPVALSEISGVSLEAAVEGIYKDLKISQVLTWTEERENVQHIIGPQLCAPDNKYITRNFKKNGKEEEELTEEEVLTEEAVLELVRPGLHIITGEPGMGKSTVLQALAHGYSPRNFVIYVQLRDCLDDIENSATLKNIKSDPIQYFYDKMTNNTDDRIAKSIMQVHKTNKRLCLFLDAFDEILPLHGRIISSLMTTILINTDVPIVCTTRPHAEEKITSRAGTISFKLLPFDDEQIEEYFTKSNINKEILWDLDDEFISNPLHLHMISQIYVGNDNLDDITTGEMYKLFIKLKHKTYNRKMNLTENVAYLSVVKSMKQHRVLALVEIFGEKRVTSAGLISNTGLAEILNDLCDQNIGIVDVRNSKKSFQFVHRTFAEYFVGDWLQTNLVQSVLNTEKCKPFYKAVWNDDDYYDIKRMIEDRTQDTDLWFEARKYFFINSANNRKRPYHKNIKAKRNKIGSVWRRLIKPPPCTCDGFEGWLKCKMSHSNATLNGSTIVHSINMDYPTRTRLTEDDGETCIKLLTAIHDENEEDVESNLARPLLETGMGIETFNLAITTGNESIVKTLLDLRPTLIDEQDVNGNTGLHISCIFGYSSIAALLFERSANFGIKNNRDKTPLGMATFHSKWEIWKMKHIGEISNGAGEDRHASSENHFSKDLSGALLGASRWSKWDIVKQLFEYGADHTGSDLIGLTPMYYACHSGELEIIKMFSLSKRGFNVNEEIGYGQTPLIVACRRGNLRTAMWLLEHGAGLAFVNAHGWTCMHLAAIGGYTEIVEMLFERGLNVNEITNDGETPLTIACEFGKFDTAVWVLDHGAVLAFVNERGWTCMHYAAKGGQSEVAKMLLERGLNVNEKTNDGETPLILACEFGKLGTAVWLLEHGAVLTFVNERGWTCMHYAAKGGQSEVAKMLLERGLNVNEKTNDGETPLTIACDYGEPYIVKWLLDHHADLTLADKSGWTPMHFAAKKPESYHQFYQIVKLDIIKVLLDKRANINIKTKDGQTPLAIARSGGWTDMVELLVKHGADESSSQSTIPRFKYIDLPAEITLDSSHASLS